ncbi:RhoGEF domain containing protein [Balamuthia mandrillaris]
MQAKDAAIEIVEEEKESQQNATKRAHIAQEILHTERAYVHSLRVIVNIYYNPLSLLAAGPTPLLSTNTLIDIFSNVSGLLALNLDLLASLEQRISQWSDTQCLGDIFLQMSPYLKCYAQYCNYYDKAVDTLHRVKASYPTFANFLKMCNKYPECKGKSLANFLVMPVQRIPRYTLLLQDLLKHTETTHKDYDNLCSALQKMEEVTNHLDESLSIARTHHILLKLQNIFGPECMDLMEPHRLFRREGMVQRIKLPMKRGNMLPTRSLKDMYLYLFNDIIILATRHSGRFRFKSRISLNGLWAIDGDDEAVSSYFSDEKNLFYIVGPDRTYPLIASEAAEKHAWLKAINECSEGYPKLFPKQKIEKNLFGDFGKENSIVHLLRRPTKRLLLKSLPRARPTLTNAAASNTISTSPPSLPFLKERPKESKASRRTRRKQRQTTFDQRIRRSLSDGDMQPFLEQLQKEQTEQEAKKPSSSNDLTSSSPSATTLPFIRSCSAAVPVRSSNAKSSEDLSPRWQSPVSPSQRPNTFSSQERDSFLSLRKSRNNI